MALIKFKQSLKVPGPLTILQIPNHPKLIQRLNFELVQSPRSHPLPLINAPLLQSPYIPFRLELHIKALNQHRLSQRGSNPSRSVMHPVFHEAEVASPPIAIGRLSLWPPGPSPAPY
eukprot:CAMPEP_0184290746 /NCGR_PEP_ID=MMETSP1049-20130417/2915_1 /TAXON_ID=77928 /ORGANISM="Proteomonas sulcata, Strain CCMP704" /LENGTH=116 /DNA_ID=CAMNT_0026597971 /DNA_START=704 /DNA_END=1051 /DNA_ORIENTATION=+